MNARSAIGILAIFVLTLSMTAFPGIGIIHPVRGDPAPTPGVDSRTLFSPSGPAVDKIQYNVYADETGEFNGLSASQIDITDTPLNSPNVPTFCNYGGTATNFFCTGPDQEFGMFEIEFNHANTFFGISDCFGQDFITTTTGSCVPSGGTLVSGSAKYPIVKSCPSGSFADSNNCTQEALDFRQGIAHLIDKAAIPGSQFACSSCPGGAPLAVALDNPLPPAQLQNHSGIPCDGKQLGLVGLACPPSGTAASTWGGYASTLGPVGGVCSWDKIDATAGVKCISAEHQAGDGVSSDGITTNIGSPDYCDAGNHWIAAGLATGFTTTCAGSTTAHLTGLSAAVTNPANSLQFYVRVDSPQRLAIGNALASKICQLLTGTYGSCSEVTVHLDTIGQVFPIVFSTCTVDAPNVGQAGCTNWHLYTGGFSLTEEYNTEWALYTSHFASTYCSATGSKTPAGTPISNDNFFCNANHDVWATGIEAATTFTDASNHLQIAQDIFGNHTGIISLYARIEIFAYVKGWTGVSDATGFGIAPGNTWTLLNAWNLNPAVAGPTIRWGNKFGTNSLNQYTFATVGEFNELQEIYDAPIALAPYFPTSGSLAGQPFLLSWMVNGFSFVAAGGDGGACPPSVTRSSEPGISFAVAGCLKINLRGDLFWQDSTLASPKPVTASDIKFSEETLNFTGAFASGGTVLTSDVVYNPSVLTQPTGQPENVYIALQTVSTFAVEDLATVPILPQHIWQARGNQLGNTSPFTPGACTTEDTNRCQVDNEYLGGLPGSTTTCGDPVIPQDTCISDGADGLASGTAIPAPNMVSSGPFFCGNGALGSVGFRFQDCTSTHSSVTASGNTIVLRRFGSGLTPANLAYFRNNANYKQWTWANFDGASTVDITDISTVTSCQSASGTLTGGCLHYDTPATTLTCNSGAGSCIGTSSGGDLDGLVTATELNQVKRWFGISWTDPVAYSTLSTPLPTGGGAQPAPQTLYDDGSQYS